MTAVIVTRANKSAQSNLGRGPRRGDVAHVRRKFPIEYNGAPHIRPQKYPFPWTDPQTPLPASSLDPSDLWCQTASGSNPPFCHNALDRPTDRPTHVRTDRPTDRPRESLITIGRCATRATRPNNTTLLAPRAFFSTSQFIERTLYASNAAAYDNVAADAMRSC